MFADLDPLALRVCSALGTGVLQGLLLAVGVLVGLRALPRSSAATRYAVAFVTLLTVAALPVIHFALHPVAPSRPVLATTSSSSPATAEHILTLPTEEFSGQGRMDDSSLFGPRAQGASVAAGVPPAVEGGVSPPGILPGSWSVSMAPTPRLFPMSQGHLQPDAPLDDHASFPSLADDLAIEPRTAWDFSSTLSMLSQRWPTRVLPIRLTLPAILAIAIALAWLLLAVVRLTSLGWQCLALQRLKRQHQPVSDPIQEQFSELCREMNVHRTVQVGVVADLRSPIAIGFFHPTILLPEALVGSTPADLDPMLRHELAHIRRRDDWTNLIQQAVKAVFFFHPGVIALSRRLNLDREIACDDHVLAATRTPRDYALFLTDFASRTHGRQWAAAPAAWSNPNQLRERIHMILDPKRNTSPRMAPMRTGILTLAALLIAATGIGAAPRLALDATEAPAATSLVSASADTDVSTDVLIVEEVTEPETLLVGLDAVRVEVTTSESDDDDDLDRPKEKPARTTGSSSVSSDDNKNANRNSRVIIRSSDGATSGTPGEKKHTLLLGAPTPAPHPEPAPHPDARPVPRPPKPARIAVETRATTIASAEERNLEERMRRLEKLVESLARKPQAPEWSDPTFSHRFEGLAKSMEQVSKDVERSMRDAERRMREAHEMNTYIAREKGDSFSPEGAGKTKHVQRRAMEMQRQALQRQIESMQSQVERLEDQLDHLDDQLEATVEVEAETQSKSKNKDKEKDKSKPRHPDARPEQDPSAPSVQEPTSPASPTPGALIRN